MLEIAVDIGGTFTDIVCLQDQQHLFLAKARPRSTIWYKGCSRG